jgi:hypothetical protein
MSLPIGGVPSLSGNAFGPGAGLKLHCDGQDSRRRVFGPERLRIVDEASGSEDLMKFMGGGISFALPVSRFAALH